MAVPQAHVAVAALGPAGPDHQGLVGPDQERGHGVGGVEGGQAQVAGLSGGREHVGHPRDPGAGLGAGLRGPVHGELAHQAGHPADAGGHRGVRGAGRRGGDRVAVGVDHLDAHLGDPGRVGGGVGGVLEVVAGADRSGDLGQPQPVAGAGLAAEEDLEAAIGVDVEGLVVEHAHRLVVHRAPGLAGLDGDRHVGGALDLAGHPVGVAGGDGGVEVDGVGVVAQHLAVGVDDAMEPWGGRVALEQSDQAPLQHVHDGPVGAEDVLVAVQVPLRRHPALVDLAEQLDQLVQGPPGLSLHPRPSPLGISGWLSSLDAQNSPQEMSRTVGRAPQPSRVTP